jgi:hypothetical protein
MTKESGRGRAHVSAVTEFPLHFELAASSLKRSLQTTLVSGRRSPSIIRADGPASATLHRESRCVVNWYHQSVRPIFWGTSNTDYGPTIADYRNHYNFRLNKCFYLELSTASPRSRDEGQYHRPAGAFSSSRLFDLQESREIGTYHQLENEVVACDMQGKECHSLLEYQALIRPFMED